MRTPAWVYCGTLGLLYRIQVRVMGADPLAMRRPACNKPNEAAADILSVQAALLQGLHGLTIHAALMRDLPHRPLLDQRRSQQSPKQPPCITPRAGR